VRQAIVVIPPRPIERPSIPDVSLRFGVDGDLKVGVPVHVSIVASALSDTFDTNIEADVSDGAHFVTDMGNRVVYRGNAVQIWNGVLTGSLSTTMSALVVADRPGAYDLRVTVHSRSGDLASSALYLPISLVPTTYSIDTSKSGPTDLYTALGTLAVESAHPVAVEEGLKGTVQLSVHATNFTASLNSVASQYGCAVVEQGGVANVVLHPETLSSTRKYGV